MFLFRNHAACLSNYADCIINKLSKKKKRNNFFIYHYSWQHFLAFLAVFFFWRAFCVVLLLIFINKTKVPNIFYYKKLQLYT